MITRQTLPLPASKKLDRLMGLRALGVGFLVALLAMVEIGDGIRPFAVAGFIAMAPVSWWSAGVGAVVGHLAGGGRLIWLLLPMAGIYLVRIRAPTITGFALVLLALTGQILFRLPMLFAGTLISYDWLLLGLELALAATAVPVFSRAREAIQRGPEGAKEGEQSLCLVVACALALTSLAGVSWGPVSLLPLFGAWATMAVGHVAGGGHAAGAGLLAGVLAGFGTIAPAPAVAAYALGGLMAGLFNIWGRVGSFAGFGAGLMAMIIYSGQAPGHLGLWDVVVAGGLFVITPSKTMAGLQRMVSPGHGEWVWEYQQRLRQATVQKLQHLAQIFARLSSSFASGGGVSNTAVNQVLMSRMFNRLACAVCIGCINYRRCWETELYSTYSQLLGHLTGAGEEIDGLLSRRCPNLEQLLNRAGELYRQFAAERQWAIKIQECKDVVSEQLRGVSDVICQFARQVRLDANFRCDIEDELAKRLTGWGVEVEELTVEGIERNLPRVQMVVRIPSGENPLGVIGAMVADAVGQKLDLMSKTEERGSSELVFALPIKYRLELGVAQYAREEVSGDCCIHMLQSPARHIYMLSDGMGKGQRARNESSQALQLARDMLEAGFKAETVIKAMNALLALRGNDERFATLDMAVVDSSTGKLELYKTGSASSFVKSGGEVEQIDGAGLPIGIVSGVEPRLVSRNLVAGDYLVMVSDGVIDGQHRDESWLINQIKSFGNVAAGTMAKQLLNRATRIGTQLHDDATVMVVRVKEAKTEKMLHAV